MIKFLRLKKKVFFSSQFFIMVIGCFSIFPFIPISFFNNPSTDDFYFFIGTIDKGYFVSQIDWYLGWSGRYFSTAILSIFPLLTKSFLIYKLVPIVLLVFLFLSIYNLSLLLFGDSCKRVSLTLTFGVLIMYLFLMPDVCQGFYWLAGSITYQLSNILMIFLFNAIIRLLNTNQIKYFLISILLILLIIGTNETSMLYLDFFLIIIVLHSYVKKKEMYSWTLIFLIFAIIFTIIVVKAPGNTIRANAFPNKHQFIYSIFKAGFASITYLLNWLPFMIIMILISSDYIKGHIQFKINKFFDLNPFFIFLIVCCIPFIGFFITYWSTGSRSPGRVINTILLFFIIGFVYLFFVVMYHFKNRNRTFITYSSFVRYFLFIIIIGQFSLKNNIKTAYLDLFSGKAYNYDLELNMRYKTIKNSTFDTCHVSSLKSKPITIFNEDITGDDKHWKNQAYQGFFKKKSIILR